MNNPLRRTVLVGLLALACLYTYRAEAPETRTYAAAGIGRLAVTTRNGAISLAAAADSQIVADITRDAYGRNQADAQKAVENVVITDTVTGDLLTIRADMPSGPRAYGAEFVLSAPAQLAPVLATTNGAVSVTGIEGDIRLSTTNGAVSLTGTTGSATVTTTNGAIAVAAHRGAISCQTTNGAINCDLAEIAATDSADVQTTNGAVTLLLPADVSATVEATTDNSRISFIGFSTITFPVDDEHHKRAVIGSGASPVTVTATNGAITVQTR